jgi:hypothetical protein
LDSFNEKKRKEADMAVRRFWYHNSLSFNYAKSYFYQPMVDAIASVLALDTKPHLIMHLGGKS